MFINTKLASEDVDFILELIKCAIDAHKDKNFFTVFDIITDKEVVRINNEQRKEYAATVVCLLEQFKRMIIEQNFILDELTYPEFEEICEVVMKPGKAVLAGYDVHTTTTDELLKGKTEMTILSKSQGDLPTKFQEDAITAKAYTNTKDLLKIICINALEKKRGCEGYTDRKLFVMRHFVSDFMPQIAHHAQLCISGSVSADSAGVISLCSQSQIGNYEIMDKFMLSNVVVAAYLRMNGVYKFQNAILIAIEKLTGQEGVQVVHKILNEEDVQFDLKKLYDETMKVFKRSLSKSELNEFEKKLEARQKLLAKEIGVTGRIKSS